MASKGLILKQLAAQVATRLLHLPWDNQGYLDLGSGSYILQVAMAGLLGGVFALKSYWTSIKTNLRAKFDKRK